VLQTKHQRSACNGFIHGLGVDCQLVSDRRANQIRAIRVKTFFDQKIDLAEVDGTEIDSDLLGLATRRAGRYGK
jgi:hypothetical protein